MSARTTTTTKAAGRTATELLERATEAAETARDAAVEFYEATARPAVQGFVEGTALPAVQHATSTAKAKGAPLLATGAGIVAEKAAVVKEHAEAQAVAPGPSRTRRLFRLFALAGLLAVIGALVAKKAGGTKEWASYEPAHSGASSASGESLGQRSTPEDPEEVVYLDGLPVERATGEDPTDQT